MLIERDRDFARELCSRHGVAFPAAHVAHNRIDALEIINREPKAFVIKNPLCSPNSPVHTIICETPGDTRAWLERVNYAEEFFLQEYLGRREAGHIALVVDGEVHSLVTNQEYKRAHAGNMGIVAGALMGGLVEADPDDRYGWLPRCCTRSSRGLPRPPTPGRSRRPEFFTTSDGMPSSTTSGWASRRRR